LFPHVTYISYISLCHLFYTQSIISFTLYIHIDKFSTVIFSLVTSVSRFIYQKLNFVAKDRHSLLWPKATTLRSHIEVVVRGPPQFVVAKSHNIWKVSQTGMLCTRRTYSLIYTYSITPQYIQGTLPEHGNASLPHY